MSNSRQTTQLHHRGWRVLPPLARRVVGTALVGIRHRRVRHLRGARNRNGTAVYCQVQGRKNDPEHVPVLSSSRVGLHLKVFFKRPLMIHANGASLAE